MSKQSFKEGSMYVPRVRGYFYLASDHINVDQRRDFNGRLTRTAMAFQLRLRKVRKNIEKGTNILKILGIG